MLVSMRVAEFDESGNRKKDYTIEKGKDSISKLDPKKPVWVVVHGRTDKEDSEQISELARTLGKTGQVITLDWRKMAADNVLPFSLDGSIWIDNVATWATNQLKAMRFSGDQINLAGHSWGSYVINSIAMKFGHVNTIVAMDSAADGYVANFLGNKYQIETIDFARYSNHSLAIYSSSFGSEKLAKTANKNITLTYPANYEGNPRPFTLAQMTHDAIADAYREHGFSITAFTAMLDRALSDPSSSAAKLLPIKQFISTITQADDTVHTNHSVSTMPYFDSTKNWWKTYPNMNQLDPISRTTSW